MKYVAFLDILGFKEKLKTISQQEAKRFIGSFSSTVYGIFQRFSDSVKGYIVSDSIILYTDDVAVHSLSSLVSLVDRICKDEFSHNGILIRGAIAKGEFDHVPAVELPKLQKQLIVGQAYVDAYNLESKVKTIGISLSHDVFQDIQNCNYNENIIEEKIKEDSHYFLRFITIDFLLDAYNMRKFVELAQKSNWLPHYYNTLCIALRHVKNDKKIEQVFRNLINTVCDNKPSENWRNIDVFIKNTFKDDVIDDYQKRFLKFIRQNIVLQDASLSHYDMNS